ncbi:MAG: glycoside hydrolase [Rhodobacteraceae bacterium]|nr:glycoside hydrolase [Paracoccaceae bacterium]
MAFAFIKATEGGDVADPLFDHHWRGAAAPGFRRAPTISTIIAGAVRNRRAGFLDAPPRAGTLPPVLDIEWTQSRNCPRRPDAETVRSEARAFIDVVTQAWGKRPIIYTTVDFWEQNELWRLGAYPFWLRSVAGHPQDTYGGNHWTFWQYTGTGRVPGVASDVDLNAFAGSEADWQSWLAAATL